MISMTEHAPDSKTRALVSALSAYGAQPSEIAAVMRITLRELESQYRFELDTSKVRAVSKVAETLYKKAIAGDTGAMIFFLRCQGGWNEKKTVTHRMEIGDPTSPAVEERLDALFERALARKTQALEPRNDVIDGEFRDVETPVA